MTSERITAGGGVVYRGGGDALRVLLIFRRGVWDLPKGKRESGETPEDCARREVAEETGLERLPEIRTYLTDTFHSYSEGDRSYEKQTFWYAMTGAREEGLIPQQEEGIERLEWVSLEEAEERVGYDNLRDVLRIFRRWLETVETLPR